MRYLVCSLIAIAICQLNINSVVANCFGGSTGNFEIFIELESGEDITVLDVEADTSFTWAARYDTDIWNDCDWVASSDDVLGYDEAVLPPNRLYKISINRTSFYYYNCLSFQRPSYEDNFFCPNGGSAPEHDLFFEQTSSGDFNVNVLVEAISGTFGNIRAYFSDNDWLVPYNLDVVCGSDTSCIDAAKEVGFFLSMQEGPVYNLTDADLTLPSDRTWYWDEVELRMKSGTSLVVNGMLSATDVTFTGGGTSWGGIDFVSGSSGTISGGSITNGSIYISNASPTIENVEFDNPSVGTHILVTGASADPLIDGNTFNGGGDGVNLQFSAQATLRGNTFTVDESAVTTHFSAIANMSPYTGGGNILGGASEGVYADYQSTVYASSGSNRFCSGSTDYIYSKHSGTYVGAMNAFWPENPPSSSKIEEVSGATVDYSYYSQSSCTSGAMLMIAGERKVESALVREATLQAGSSIEKDTRQKLQTAIDLMQHSAFTERAADRVKAADMFQEIVEGAPNSPEAPQALMGLWRIVRLEKSENHRLYFEKLASEPGPLRPAALAILVGAYEYWSNNSEALEAAATLEQEYASTWYGFYGTMSRFWLAVNDGLYGDAQRILNSYRPQADEEDARLEDARDLLAQASELESPGMTYPAYAAFLEDIKADSHESLEANVYPNPFNPVATIQYTIEAEGHVALTVYDILGKVVRTLVDDVVSPGTHNARFAAEEMPSGLYLYHLQYGGQEKIGKMFLVK